MSILLDARVMGRRRLESYRLRTTGATRIRIRKKTA